MNKIRETRLARKMTLMDLAVASGLAISSVADIEADRTNPRIDTAQALAAALGTTVDGLWPMLDRHPETGRV